MFKAVFLVASAIKYATIYFNKQSLSWIIDALDAKLGQEK